MKKTLKGIFMILCAGLMIFAFTACSDEEKGDKKGDEKSNVPAIVGTWEYEDSSEMYYTFNEDGTGAYFFIGDEMKFTYEDDGKALTIQYENATGPNVFEYKIDGKKLLIEDSFGETVTYIKK